MDSTKSNNSKILRERISAFIDSNDGFLEMMELKQFLNDLPYDVITTQEFEDVIDEFKGKNTTVEFLLLQYSVNQILFYESQSNQNHRFNAIVK